MVLLVLTFCFPIILALLFFPTPAMDLGEQINWGAQFPLRTWKHPPLQSWMAGAVALTSARDSGLYVVVAQILNFTALFYMVGIARDFMGRDTVVPLVIAFCGSLYVTIGTLIIALDADQLLPPLWLGLLYHALHGLRGNRIWHWLACGVLAGLAMLAKYTSLLYLLSLTAAVITIPECRVILRKPGPYIATGIALVLFSFHLQALLLELDPFGHAFSVFLGFGSPFYHGASFLRFIQTLIIFNLPILIALSIAKRRGLLHTIGAPREGHKLIIVRTVTLIYTAILLLIVGAGLTFRSRWGAPMQPLFLLALFCMVRLEPQTTRVFAVGMMAVLGLLFVGSMGLALLHPHSNLQEPAPAAAGIMRADWDRQFPCGPAYVIGNGAHSVGLYFGRSVLGLSPEAFLHAYWVDKEKMHRLGAVLVGNFEQDISPAFAKEFPQRTSPVAISLPYRRAWVQHKQNYSYSFLPPQRC